MARNGNPVAQIAWAGARFTDRDRHPVDVRAVARRRPVRGVQQRRVHDADDGTRRPRARSTRPPRGSRGEVRGPVERIDDPPVSARSHLPPLRRRESRRGERGPDRALAPRCRLRSPSRPAPSPAAAPMHGIARARSRRRGGPRPRRRRATSRDRGPPPARLSLHRRTSARAVPGWPRRAPGAARRVGDRELSARASTTVAPASRHTSIPPR